MSAPMIDMMIPGRVERRVFRGLLNIGDEIRRQKDPTMPSTPS